MGKNAQKKTKPCGSVAIPNGKHPFRIAGNSHDSWHQPFPSDQQGVAESPALVSHCVCSPPRIPKHSGRRPMRVDHRSYSAASGFQDSSYPMKHWRSIEDPLKIYWRSIEDHWNGCLNIGTSFNNDQLCRIFMNDRILLVQDPAQEMCNLGCERLAKLFRGQRMSQSTIDISILLLTIIMLVIN